MFSNFAYIIPIPSKNLPNLCGLLPQSCVATAHFLAGLLGLRRQHLGLRQNPRKALAGFYLESVLLDKICQLCIMALDISSDRDLHAICFSVCPVWGRDVYEIGRMEQQGLTAKVALFCKWYA